jgi:preprotein translocase subunit SecD
MHFRGLLIGTACALSLTACGSKGVVVKYDFTVDLNEPEKVWNLTESAERVLARRLAAAEVADVSVSTVPNSSGGTITVKLPNAEAAKVADNITKAPFSFDLRVEKTPPGTTGDSNEDNWIKTAIDASSLHWVQAIGNRATGVISIDLQFNPEGKKILTEVFAANKGKSIGIFVRDLLVSKLKIEKTEISEHVIIEGVPSAKVAEIFADDVNVGLHVTFSPAR